MKHRAFALWELLVVVAVVAIGAAIILPPSIFNGPGRERARRSSCQSNLKQIGLAFLQYNNNYDNTSPPVANARGGWARLLQPYLKSEAIFHCPSANGDENGATDYFYNARLAGAKNEWGNNTKPVFAVLSGDGLDDQNASYHLSQFPDAWRTDENSPPWRHLDAANYLFIDGHVKAYPAKQIFGARDVATPTFEVK